MEDKEKKRIKGRNTIIHSSNKDFDAYHSSNNQMNDLFHSITHGVNNQSDRQTMSYFAINNVELNSANIPNIDLNHELIIEDLPLNETLKATVSKPKVKRKKASKNTNLQQTPDETTKEEEISINSSKLKSDKFSTPVQNQSNNVEKPEDKLELSKREANIEKIDSQEIFIKQLKENNKVLKDLMRNKNKEIVTLEKQLKTDKLESRKELLNLKKKIKDKEDILLTYQNFIKSLLSDFFDNGIPSVIDDPRIIEYCKFLIFIPNSISSYSEVFKKDSLMPNDFLESIDKLKQAVKSAEEEDKQEDNNQSDADEVLGDEDIENPEEQFEPQISMQDFSHIQNSNKSRVQRGNSATVIMMGSSDAEQFLKNRLSNAQLYKHEKNNVRYLSNIPEQFMNLKSLNAFKEKGRWELMPKGNNPELNESQDLEGEEDEEYYEYDDYEQEIEQEVQEKKAQNNKQNTNKGKKVSKSESEEEDLNESANYRDSKRITLTNHNKYYKK